MSQPKRYRPILNNRKEVVMAEDVSGDWTSLTVYYTLHDKTLLLASDNAALKAENERLRKAGDAMDEYLKRQDGTTNGMLSCREAWLAAKEGRDAK
jgi:hypothetical protein